MLETGRPALAVVVGEAGAGKTSVAAHFAADDPRQPAPRCCGAAPPRRRWCRSRPLVQALRTALLAMSPRARERVVANRGALAVLLPELLQLVPTMRAELPAADVERYLLFETVAEMLASESAVRPILLVIDDVQWADGGTIKLLEHVLRHERGGRVLVLATQRDPSEDPHPELDRLLMALTRDDELRPGARRRARRRRRRRAAAPRRPVRRRRRRPALGDRRQRLLRHRADHQRRRRQRRASCPTRSAA